jgi:sterol desaturase/sphingolipid hydroxylase (fatty acid hydroxylase superfamily)
MTFPDIVTYAVPFFILLIIAEMIYTRMTGRTHYDAKDSAASLLMGFGNQIAGLATGIIAVATLAWSSQFALFDLGYAWWVFFLCFFAEDLSYYWTHRISHERRWFWASHVIHHSSQHYNLSTALRQTWTGNLGLVFLFRVPLVLVGFPPEMVALFGGISLVYQFWIHTEAIGRMGPLEWVLNTPSHHRVHHATNPRYLDANYAGVLIIWDRMFGTYVPEDDAERPVYGILSNLNTFNPFRIAFHEWAGIARDVLSAKSLKDVGGFLLGPPGWSPDASRKTSAMVKAEAAARGTLHQQPQTGADAPPGLDARA